MLKPVPLDAPILSKKRERQPLFCFAKTVGLFVAVTASTLNCASAFADLGGCDVVNIRADMSLSEALGSQSFLAYDRTLQAAFEKKPSTGSFERLAEDIVAAQRQFLAGAASRIDVKAYLLSPACQLIDSLNASSLQALADENIKSSNILGAHKKRIAELLALANERQADALRRVRFRTPQAMALFKAGYACFAASLVTELMSFPDGVPPPLRSMGIANSCQQYGRSSAEWVILR